MLCSLAKPIRSLFSNLPEFTVNPTISRSNSVNKQGMIRKTIGKYFLVASLLFCTQTPLGAQTLTSIAPDNAQQGDSLPVTITGQDTTFLQGSWTTVTSIWFSRGSLTIPGISIFASSSTEVSANFDIPGDAAIGLWDVNVDNTVDGPLMLADGFTIIDTTPPTPNPITWASSPAAAGPTSISMTATTATDPSGVEYYFEETSGNPGATDSGWQAGKNYTETGLHELTQ